MENIDAKYKLLKNRGGDLIKTFDDLAFSLVLGLTLKQKMVDRQIYFGEQSARELLFALGNFAERHSQKSWNHFSKLFEKEKTK